MSDLVEKLRNLRNAPEITIQVGWPEDGPGGPEVAKIAAILQEGTSDGRIPARPVLDRVAFERSTELTETSQEIARALLAGDYSEALEAAQGFAEESRQAVAQRLDAGVPPGNAPSTVARKGIDLPLRNPGGADRLYRHLVGRARST